MKTMTVQATTMAVMVAAAMLLGCGMVAQVEGRALLDLGKVIDHLIDCPPPPADDVPAPEPYSAPYYSPPDVVSPAPAAYEPNSPEYQSPPGPPYADVSPPVYEPSPEYQTPLLEATDRCNHSIAGDGIQIEVANRLRILQVSSL